MQLSLTPILLTAELGFVVYLAQRYGRLTGGKIGIGSFNLYAAWIIVYAGTTTYLGACGMYVRDDLMAYLPGLWLQLITVAAFIVPILLSSNLRGVLRGIVDQTPLHWFAWFHLVRIAALGTAYKTYTGEFPAYFEYLVGIPDLLFALSVLWIAPRVAKGEVGEIGFMWWNLLGALVIVPSAPILLQLGLPGPLQVFHGIPDARAVFTYPMSIAPMIGVPLIVMINLWVAWRLWERVSKRALAAS